MTPDQINERDGTVHYRCRACGAGKNLRWFGGTSCPVCKDNEACATELSREVEEARQQEAFYQIEYEERYGR